MQENNGTFRVRLFSGGVLVGRAHWHDAAWFKLNAVKVWFGALHVPGGRGSNSRHLVDRTFTTVHLEDPAGAPEDHAAS